MSIIWGSPQQLFLKGPAPKGSGALLSVPVLPSALLTLGNPHLVKTNVVSRNRTTHISAHPQTSLAVPSVSLTPKNQAPSLCAAGGTSSLLWGDAVWGYLTPGAGILLWAPVTCSEPCRQAPCGTQGGQSPPSQPESQMPGTPVGHTPAARSTSSPLALPQLPLPSPGHRQSHLQDRPHQAVG